MSKYPTPWTLVSDRYLEDANGATIAHIDFDTDDPEARAVLLHAGEMFAALNEITSVEPGSPAHRHEDKMCCELMRKIEFEIAAGSKP